MKKYLAVFLISLKNTLNYRAELVMWSFIDAVPLLGNLVLWSTVFMGQATINGYTQTTMIAYYLIGYIFLQVTGSHFEDYYVKEIINGNISSRLYKPVSLKKAMVVEEISWRVTGSIITLTPIIVLAWFLGVKVINQISASALVSLLLVLCLGYFIDAIFSLAIIATGFIFEEARSLMHLKWMVSWLFSGSMIPFELMPSWLAKIAALLPFQTRYFLPTSIYTGAFSPAQTTRGVLVTAVWAFVLYWWIKWYWAKNLKKFSAVGS